MPIRQTVMVTGQEMPVTRVQMKTGRMIQMETGYVLITVAIFQIPIRQIVTVMEWEMHVMAVSVQDLH